MSRIIYHVLPETEAFSEFSGGAISRWVANVIRNDEESVVLCPSSDFSWNIPRARVLKVTRLATYGRFRKLAYKVGWPVRRAILKQTLRPALAALRSGDIVWLHNRPDLAAAIQPIVYQARASLVLHMHNSFLAQQSPQRVRQIQADRYVFVSQFLKSEALQHVPDLPGACVLYNGADHKIFFPADKVRGSDQNVPTILFAGRLVPNKGAHVFIGAMRELERRQVAARGVIVGASEFGGSKETPYMRQLHQDAPSNVGFKPYCAGAKLGKLFRTADIFCMPSTWQDPFPLAPLEAMASRLPVVASRSGGIPEAFREGGGIMVSRNSIPELTEALQRMVEDPELRRATAAAGEESFQRNFTWEAVHVAYRSIADAIV